MPCEKLECCRLQSVLLAARPVSVGTPCLLFSSCSFSRSVYYLLVAGPVLELRVYYLLVAGPVLELRVYYLLVARHSVSVGTVTQWCRAPPTVAMRALRGYTVD